MYKPLMDLSQDWIFPGLRKVPPNTVSLLVSNQSFIEAYMVGLNHEMSRKLLGTNIRWASGAPTFVSSGMCRDSTQKLRLKI